VRRRAVAGPCGVLGSGAEAMSIWPARDARILLMPLMPAHVQLRIRREIVESQRLE